MYKNFIKILVIFSFTMVLVTGISFAEPINTVEQIKDAEEYFLNGEYRQAIEIYDDILDTFPDDSKIEELQAYFFSMFKDDLIFDFAFDVSQKYLSLIHISEPTRPY